ncbi:hypothetical protein BP5796_03687 [Coleophoma crateriformis]|uniref:Rhodopsin domain-containing protein n=1 Tax=Coleophoma crateriformis TaxID=565419 RepID=A0A3D8SGD7_9HELO|nr:hypothetical protein BP5796_03687 [Coleophoma crateriformis]
MQWFDSFKIESWTLYSVAASVALTRIGLRIWHLGIKGLQLDDYGMVIALLLYSTLLVLDNHLAASTGVYTDSIFTDPTPQDIRNLVSAAKLLVGSEQVMQLLTYSLKGCVFLMYSRLRIALKQDIQKSFNTVAIYTFLCYVGTTVAFWTLCYPPSGYWTLPPPNG